MIDQFFAMEARQANGIPAQERLSAFAFDRLEVKMPGCAESRRRFDLPLDMKANSAIPHRSWPLRGLEASKGPSPLRETASRLAPSLLFHDT